MKPLPNKAIEEYKVLFKKEFGRDLTDEEARQSAESLLRVVELAFQVPIEAIITKDNDDALRRVEELLLYKEVTGHDSPEIMRRLSMYFQAKS